MKQCAHQPSANLRLERRNGAACNEDIDAQSSDLDQKKDHALPKKPTSSCRYPEPQVRSHKGQPRSLVEVTVPHGTV